MPFERKSGFSIQMELIKSAFFQNLGYSSLANSVNICSLNKTMTKTENEKQEYRLKLKEHMDQERKINQQMKTEKINILRVNVVDIYRGLVDKVKYGYKGILEKFPKTEFVIKGDDDVIIQLARIEKYLRMTLNI